MSDGRSISFRLFFTLGALIEFNAVLGMISMLLRVCLRCNTFTCGRAVCSVIIRLTIICDPEFHWVFAGYSDAEYESINQRCGRCPDAPAPRHRTRKVCLCSPTVWRCQDCFFYHVSKVAETRREQLKNQVNLKTCQECGSTAPLSSKFCGNCAHSFA